MPLSFCFGCAALSSPGQAACDLCALFSCTLLRLAFSSRGGCGVPTCRPNLPPLLLLQGLEEGYTRPCWPIQTPGIAAHRSVRHNEQPEAAASKRWDLLGGWVVALPSRVGVEAASSTDISLLRG